jgi:hypothetical protein
MAALFPMPVMYLDENADALAGGSILIENAGTSVVASIYADNGLTTPLANPYTLDGSGRAPQIWGNAASFKITVKDAAGVAKVGPVDNVPALADAATLGSIDPWTVTSLAVGSAGQHTVSDDGIVTNTAQPRATAYRATSAQSILNNTLTAIQLNAEAFDIGGMHDLAVNNTRVTIPAASSGVYLAIGSVRYAANATGLRSAQIRLNGTTIVQAEQRAGADAAIPTFVQTMTLQTLIAGDYLELMAYQTSGGALDVDADIAGTSLAVVKLF